MSSETTTTHSLYSFIVLTALLQGLALFAVNKGRELGWWPFDSLGGCIYWYTLILSVPTVMTLTVQDLADRRFWQQVAGVAIAYAALASWAVWSATGAPGLQSNSVLGPFGMTIAAGLFVLLPYLQCRLKHQAWTAPYPELFENAWQNGLTLVLVAPFVGLCWVVLWLWGALFELVQIHFFRDLFKEQAFVYMATGVMVGLGILIARMQKRPLQILRQIVFAVFRGLLPLVAFIAVLFLVCLPFVGLAPLWDTRSATAILVTLIYLIVLFVNAVFQDCADHESGSPEATGSALYPKPLWRLIQAGLIVLPVYAGIALYALWLRVDQYGWTAERWMALFFVLLVSGHALGYCWAALRPGPPLAAMPRVNVLLSFASLVFIAALNSPIADPFRVTVDSQRARLQDGRLEPEKLDLEHLRFANGRRGYAFVQSLKADPKVAAKPELLADIDRVLEKTERWGRRRVAEGITVEQARQRVELVAGTAAPDDSWFQAVIDGHWNEPCFLHGSHCVVLGLDIDADVTPEYLYCELSGRRDKSASCTMTQLRNDVWTRIGTINSPFDATDEGVMRDAILAGRVGVEPHPLPDLVIAGKRFVLRTNDRCDGVTNCNGVDAVDEP